MGQDFYRIIDGYNFPFRVTAGGVMARDAWLTVNVPGGPGRIEQIIYLTSDIHLTNPVLDRLTLTIDGINIFDAIYGYNFWGVYNIDTADGPIASRTTGLAWVIIQRFINLDYRSSASLSIQNTYSPDPTSMYLFLFGRQGI